MCGHLTGMLVVALLLADNFVLSSTSRQGKQGCRCTTIPHQPTTEPNAVCTTNPLMGADSCVPLNFGVGRCNEWDQDFAYCNGSAADAAAASAFCDEPWCYVNASECHSSDQSYWRSTLFGSNVELYYSYSTCGGDQRVWEAANVLAGLKGKTIRAAIPKLYYPSHYHTNATNHVVDRPEATDIELTTNLKGFWIDYYTAMAAAGQFSIEWKAVSHFSRGKYSSAWTACTRDVQRGLIDVCVGNFWTTPERLQMTNFLTASAIENFYMMTKRPVVDVSFGVRASIAYKPFTLELWLLVIFLVCFMGCTYTITSKQSKQAKAYIYNIYAASLELFGASVSTDSGTVGQNGQRQSKATMFLKVAWAFFILALVGGYTANLAAQLTSKSLKKNEIASIEDCINQGCTLCVHGSQKVVLYNLYGSRLNTQVVGNNGKTVVAHALDPSSSDLAPDVKCDAYILDPSTVYTFFSKPICDWKFVGGVINWFGVSQPVVNYTVGKALSILQQKLVASGSYKEVRNTFLPARTCNMFLDIAEAGSAAEPIQISHFFGPLLLLGFAALVAVLAAFVTKGAKIVQRRNSVSPAAAKWFQATDAATARAQAHANGDQGSTGGAEGKRTLLLLSKSKPAKPDTALQPLALKGKAFAFAATPGASIRITVPPAGEGDADTTS